MSGLSHVDDYPEIPVSLGATHDVLETGDWRSMRPVRLDRLAPCTAGCPASVPVPRYFHLLAAGRVAEAFAVVSLRNPFPRITGRVCPHMCEHDCNRRTSGAALSIRAIERFLGDAARHVPHAMPEEDTGKRVAVVGSGPTGLAAAYYLRRSGHKVVVLERRRKPGGLLRYAIPEFRMPAAIVDDEVARLEGMGIEFRTGVSVGTDVGLAELVDDFDDVFTTPGRWDEDWPDVPGAHLLASGLAFLARAAHAAVELPGERCAVAGAGDTGLDTARLLRRLGAEVTVVFEGATRDVPGLREGYFRAVKEGVQFAVRTRLVAVEASDGEVRLTLEDLRSGERRSTGFDAAFVGSDRVMGPPNVVEAITAGRLGAEAVNARIGGGYATPDWLDVQDVVGVEEVNAAYAVSGHRVRETDRTDPTTDAEDTLTLSEAEALAEIERCLSCGHCNECGTCFVFCPDAAIRWSPEGPVIDYVHCKGCGICVTECPGHAIAYVPEREPDHV